MREMVGKTWLRFGGMTWPLPGEALGQVQWNLRYGKPTRSDLLQAASVMAAYDQMIMRDTAKKRAYVVRELRAGMLLTDSNYSQSDKEIKD